jgi:Xaa-Pro aminopeptidase
MTEKISSAVYLARRQALASQLGPHDVAIIPTSVEQVRNRDSSFPFRHDSYFHYLTGFTEPNAYLVLFSNARTVLLLQPKDMEREIWDGYRLGPEAAPLTLGVDEAHSIADIDTLIPRFLENTSSVWYPFNVHAGLTQKIEHWLTFVQAKSRSGVRVPGQFRDICSLLDEMRLIKDEREQSIMRTAARISAEAHIRAMKYCSNSLRSGQTIREYHLEAEILHEFRHSGADFPAYSSIVAAGANACVLHYRADKAIIRPGELVLIDAGCEYAGYAGDITRTFPADGRFTKPQRALYEVVLESQHAAVQATHAGALFTDPHLAALRVLAKGLLDLKILNANVHGGVDDVLEHKHYFPFYMHRTSHWLGMDVHDSGSYVEPVTAQDPHLTQRATTTSNSTPTCTNGNSPPQSRVLRPGMVLTLEPGLYVRASRDVPLEFHNLGIRIEDDALVRERDCELISRAVPVDPLEIERLMN